MSNGSSYFTMDVITEVSKMTDFEQAKQKATEVVEQSSARTNNKQKAFNAINNAKSIDTLVISMSNFMLSHPAEGLGVIK